MELKVLNPVLITKNLYVPMNIFSDEKISSSEKVSKFESIKPPYCDYVSFQQTFPINLNQAISTLVYQPGSPSVFQLITSQLYYKVEWICRNNLVTNVSRKRVRVLILDVEDQKGYEPWDVKGNRICIRIPEIGKTTKGCFVLPGNYLFFVLEDTTRSCEFEIKITAFYPKLDYWEVSDSSFCVRDTSCRKIFAYRNSKASLGRIQRTLNPELFAYQEAILQEYKKNPGLPCLIPPSVLSPQSLGTYTMEIKVDTRSGQQFIKGFAGSDLSLFCRASYSNLVPTLENTPYWITQQSHITQFVLSIGRYRMGQIVFSGSSDIQEEFYPPPVEPFTATGPNYYCNSQDLALLFYSVNEQNPVKILGGSDPPTLSDDANNTVAMITNPKLVEPEIGGVPVPTLNYVRFEIDGEGKYFYFDVTSSANIFAFRLNSPIFYTFIQYESGDTADIFRTRYTLQNASVTIEKIF